MPTYLDPRLGISYSEAIAESMASNTLGDPLLLTLELQNSNFVDDDGNPTSVWIVNDFAAFDAYDEDSVLRTFLPVPFRYTKPEQTDGGAPAAVQIEVDNISQVLTRQLLLAGRTPVYVVEREYLPSDPSAPHVLPPTRMAVTSVKVGGETVTGQASFGDFTNRKFPFATYTREEFPALAAQ